MILVNDNYLRKGPEFTVSWHWLLFKYIQNSSGNPLLLESTYQVCLPDDSAATYVNENSIFGLAVLQDGPV